MRKSLSWGVCVIAVGALAAVLGTMGFVGIERSAEAESKSDGGFIRLLDQSDELEDALADAGASSVAIAFRCPPES